MSKKIAFSPKPAPQSPSSTPDAWVENRGYENTKRLTLDLPASLHARIKAACALQGTHMRDEIHKLLDQHFPTSKL